VTVAWCLVIRGMTLALDARRAGRTTLVAVHALVAIAGFALFATALVFGLIVMTTK
jgi:hypothetical protein